MQPFQQQHLQRQAAIGLTTLDGSNNHYHNHNHHYHPLHHTSNLEVVITPNLTTQHCVGPTVQWLQAYYKNNNCLPYEFVREGGVGGYYEVLDDHGYTALVQNNGRCVGVVAKGSVVHLVPYTNVAAVCISTLMKLYTVVPSVPIFDVLLRPNGGGVVMVLPAVPISKREVNLDDYDTFTLLYIKAVLLEILGIETSLQVLAQSLVRVPLDAPATVSFHYEGKSHSYQAVFSNVDHVLSVHAIHNHREDGIDDDAPLHFLTALAKRAGTRSLDLKKLFKMFSSYG
eukprot:PhF_6_TR40435/c1_g1_i4/m.60309